MTLNRKGLIRHYTHAIWYTAALILCLFHMWNTYQSMCFFAKVALVYIMRVKLRMNKYLIWNIVVWGSLPETQVIA